jgi:hypothetical protein
MRPYQPHQLIISISSSSTFRSISTFRKTNRLDLSVAFMRISLVRRHRSSNLVKTSGRNPGVWEIGTVLVVQKLSRYPST